METDFSNFCWFICTLFNLQASVEDKRVIFAIVSADVSVLIHQEPTLSMSDHHHNDFRVFTGRWPPFDIDKAKRGTRPVTLLFMRASWAVIVWKYLTRCKFDAISSGSSIEAVFESVLHQNELSICFRVESLSGVRPWEITAPTLCTRNTKGVCVGWSWPVWFIVSEQYFCSREKVHTNVKLFGL